MTIPKVVNWAKAARLEIAVISGYCDFAQNSLDALHQEIERLLHSGRVATKMSVNIVRSFVGDVKPNPSFADVWPQIVDAFKETAAADGIF